MNAKQRAIFAILFAVASCLALHAAVVTVPLGSNVALSVTVADPPPRVITNTIVVTNTVTVPGPVQIVTNTVTVTVTNCPPSVPPVAANLLTISATGTKQAGIGPHFFAKLNGVTLGEVTIASNSPSAQVVSFPVTGAATGTVQIVYDNDIAPTATESRDLFIYSVSIGTNALPLSTATSTAAYGGWSTTKAWFALWSNGTLSIAIPGAVPVASLASPYSVTATATSPSSIAVAWADSNAVPVTFDVEHALADAGPWSFVGNVSQASFEDRGLASATTYFYRIKAVSP